MSDPYVGEIRLFAGTFAPVGWALCNGAILPISENDMLFNLIGTTYGGDGQSTFALPDLRGRVPVHVGGWTFVVGETGGVEQVTLNASNAPVHPHTFQAVETTANNRSAQGQALARLPAGQGYLPIVRATLMVPPGPNAGGQPHENRAPYLAINYIVSLFGIYPYQA
jgi:microcystin-dependent protein